MFILKDVTYKIYCIPYLQIQKEKSHVLSVRVGAENITPYVK